MLSWIHGLFVNSSIDSVVVSLIAHNISNEKETKYHTIVDLSKKSNLYFCLT